MKSIGKGLENIKYLDIFSEETGFTDNGKNKFRSWIGVLLSICLVTASIILTLLFGKEVYERKKPIVSSSSEYQSNSQVNMLDWPVFIIVSDYKGNRIEEIEKYYVMYTYKMNYTAEGKVDYSSETRQFPITRCNASHFERVKDKINSEELRTYLSYPSFCVNYIEGESYFQNPYKSLNSTFLDIDFRRCIPEKEHCADDFEKVTSESYVNIYFMNSYVDSFDYNNPVKYFYDTITTQLTNTNLKRNYIYISNNHYDSDNGWILEDYIYTEYYSLQQIVTEINSIPEYNPHEALWNTFISPYLRTRIVRQYTKVQDLFANIGGIVNAFLMIIQILFSHYFRYNYQMSLREHLNPSSENYSEKRKSLFRSYNNFTSFNNQDSFKKDSSKYFVPKLNNIDINREDNKDKSIKIENYNYDNIEKISNKSTPISNIINKNKYNTMNLYNKDIYNQNNNLNIEDAVSSNKNKDDNNNNNKNSNISNNNSKNSISVSSFKNNNLEEININDLNKFNQCNSKVELFQKKNAINPINPYLININKNINVTELNNNTNIIINNKESNDKFFSLRNMNNNIGDKYKSERKSIQNNFPFNIINSSNNNNNVLDKIISDDKECNPASNNINNYFQFKFVSFKDFNYIKFLCYKLFCSKRARLYNEVRNEIDNLYDIYRFSMFLKYQYLNIDPLSIQE